MTNPAASLPPTIPAPAPAATTTPAPESTEGLAHYERMLAAARRGWPPPVVLAEPTWGLSAFRPVRRPPRPARRTFMLPPAPTAADE